MKFEFSFFNLFKNSKLIYQNSTPEHIESQKYGPDTGEEINELKLQIESELGFQENLQAKFRGIQEWLQNYENTQKLTVEEVKRVIKLVAIENNVEENVIASAMGIDWTLLDFIPDQAFFRSEILLLFPQEKQEYINLLMNEHFGITYKELSIPSRIYLKMLFSFENQKGENWKGNKDSIKDIIDNPDLINESQLIPLTQKNEKLNKVCQLNFILGHNTVSPRYSNKIVPKVEELSILENELLLLHPYLLRQIQKQDNVLSIVYMELFYSVTSNYGSMEEILNFTKKMVETNHPNFNKLATLPATGNSYQKINLTLSQILSFSERDMKFIEELYSKYKQYPSALFRDSLTHNQQTGEYIHINKFIGQTEKEKERILFFCEKLSPPDLDNIVNQISQEHLLDDAFWKILHDLIIETKEGGNFDSIKNQIVRFAELLNVFEVIQEDISPESYKEVESLIMSNEIDTLSDILAENILDKYGNNRAQFYEKYSESEDISLIAKQKISQLLNLDRWKYIHEKYKVDIDKEASLHIFGSILESESKDSFVYNFIDYRVGSRVRRTIQELTIQDEVSHRPSRERLNAIEGFNPKDIYALITHGEREFDADAFKPLFDGYSRSEKRFDNRTLMGKIMTDFDGNGYEFLNHVDPEFKSLPTFFSILSRYNRLDKFFLTLQNPKELKIILQKLVEHASVGSTSKQFGNMVAISEILEKLSKEIPMEEGITVYAQALSRGMKKQKRRKFKRIIRKIENGIELTAIEKKRFGEDIKDAFGNVRKNTISIIERSIYQQSSVLQQAKENATEKWEKENIQAKINLLKILASEHASHKDESGNTAHHLQNKRIDFVVSIEDIDPNKLINEEDQKALESDINRNEYSTLFAQAGLDYNEIESLPHTSTDTQKGLDSYQIKSSLVSNIQLQKIIKKMRQEMILDEVHLSYEDLQKLPYETSFSAGLEAYQRSDLYKDNAPFQEIITELIQERQLSDATADFFLEAAEEIQLPNIEKLQEEALFGKDNVQNQFHYFYNDNDGRASFRHFVSTYGMAVGNIRHRKANNPINKKNGWKSWSEGEYIVLQKKDEPSGRTVNMYVVDPKKNNANEGNKALRALNEREGINPETIVHRGHSFHVKKTIDDIPESSVLVNLGSCGGYSNVSDALDKAAEAHVLSTTGTGVMAVNDPVFKAMNEWMLERGNINWNDFEQSMNAKFKVNEDKSPTNRLKPSRSQRMYANYTFPHNNKAIVLKQIWEKMKTN